VGKTVARRLVANLLPYVQSDFYDDFARLPKFVLEMTQADPDGRYFIKSTGMPGDNRFESVYLCPGSGPKVFKKSSKKIIVIDGASVKTIVGGCLLGAFTYDSNRHLQLLALQYCASENGPSCDSFVENLKIDYEGIELVMQDAGPSLISACETNGLVWRRCAQHIVKNLRTEFPGLPKAFDDEVYALARATTEAIQSAQLAKMRSEFSKFSAAVDWLVDRQSQFVSRYFLARGIHNFAMITNNASEQSWKFIDSARSRVIPLISMLVEIFRLFSEKQLKERLFALERQDQAAAYTLKREATRLNIVPWLVETLDDAVQRMRKKEVRFTKLDTNSLIAAVRLSKSRNITANVHLQKNPFVATCSYCQRFRDTGFMCDCMIAAVYSASQKAAFTASWSSYSTHFLHTHWTLLEWVSQKGVLTNEILFQRVSVDLSDGGRLRPWNTPPPKPGRKKGGKDDKERREKKAKPNARAEYICGGCGEPGHNISRCPKVDLDYWRNTLNERANGVKNKRKKQRVDNEEIGDGDNFMGGDDKNVDGDDISDFGTGFSWSSLQLGPLDEWQESITAIVEPAGGEDDLNLSVARDHVLAVAISMGLTESKIPAAIQGESFFLALSDQLVNRLGITESSSQVCCLFFFFCGGIPHIFLRYGMPVSSSLLRRV
jgi:hypothetical protein